jgi:hypothetical protein
MDKETVFTKYIGGLAIIYGKDLGNEALLVYVCAILDLSLEDLKRSINLWLNHSGGPFFPTPGQLRSMLRPSDDQVAREVVARIVNALSRFGGGDNSERAKEYIGELGWLVVKKNGGWEETCKTGYAQLQTAQAHWREYAISLLAQDRSGTLDIPPALPSTQQKKLQSIGDIVKLPGSRAEHSLESKQGAG